MPSAPGSAVDGFPLLADRVPDLFVLAAFGQGVADGGLEDDLVELRPHAVDDFAVERLVGLKLAVQGAELGVAFAAEAVAGCRFAVGGRFLLRVLFLGCTAEAPAGDDLGDT